MKIKSKLLFSVIFMSFIIIIPFQNCSKVQMRDVDLMNKSTGGFDGLGGPLPSDPGVPSNSGPSVGGGQSTTPMPISTPGAGATTPPLLPSEIEARDWLNANCDESSLGQSPLSISFAASGGSVQVTALRQDLIEISDKKSVEAAQLTAKTLSIQKTEQLEIQQVRAEKINIEALEINKIQQISADEINVHANSISGTFQQMAACSSGGPKLRLQATTVNEVHQLSALCLRTNSARKIQQIPFVKIIGDGENAKIGEIQQVRELLVLNTEVGLIQQIDILILKNTKVKKVQQVRKLILINSSAEEISQVHEISEQ